MFIGHYGPAAAADGERVKLWHAFVAVQLVDYIWSIMILTGIEKVRIVEGFTAASPLDLHYMPYTHSLPGAAFWAVLAAVLFRLWRPTAGLAGALIIGALVFSHWMTDLIVHVPDLALWPGGPKVGYGLWNTPAVSHALEVAFAALAIGVYSLRTRPKNTLGQISPLLVFVALVSLQAYGALGPLPPSPSHVAISALFAYTLIAALGALIDATRRPKS
ncbi:MAG: metal-dependent hydrolase [Pseudomonadota bacterium]